MAPWKHPSPTSLDATQSGITHFLIPSVNLMLNSSPISTVLSAGLMAATALYGTYLQVQQDKLNSFVQWILENPETFIIELFEQEAFQEGFFITLEQYLKSRNDDKRELIKQIFLDFASKEKKEEFELERLLETITNLSPKAIQYIRFLITDVLPLLYKISEDKAKTSARPRNEGGQTEAWWYRQNLIKNEPISQYIEKWIDQNFDPNTPSVAARHGYDQKDHLVLGKIYDEKLPHTELLREMAAEFTSLGIFYNIPGIAVVGGSTPEAHTFTEYGWQIIKYFEGIK